MTVLFHDLLVLLRIATADNKIAFTGYEPVEFFKPEDFPGFDFLLRLLKLFHLPDSCQLSLHESRFLCLNVFLFLYSVLLFAVVVGVGVQVSGKEDINGDTDHVRRVFIFVVLQEDCYNELYRTGGYRV